MGALPITTIPGTLHEAGNPATGGPDLDVPRTNDHGLGRVMPPNQPIQGSGHM